MKLERDMQKTRGHVQRGFTMIELLVVMAVLGILAATVMPLGETMVKAQKERELRHSLNEIRQALDEHKRAADTGAISVAAGQSGYPRDLRALVEGVPDARDPGKTGILYFLRRVPRDPFADARIPAEQTWTLRSYASPPDRPQAGADVYDVHSTSPATALDGSLYAAW